MGLWTPTTKPQQSTTKKTAPTQKTADTIPPQFQAAKKVLDASALTVEKEQRPDPQPPAPRTTKKAERLTWPQPPKLNLPHDLALLMDKSPAVYNYIMQALTSFVMLRADGPTKANPWIRIPIPAEMQPFMRNADRLTIEGKTNDFLSVYYTF